MASTRSTGRSKSTTGAERESIVRAAADVHSPAANDPVAFGSALALDPKVPQDIGTLVVALAEDKLGWKLTGESSK